MVDLIDNKEMEKLLIRRITDWMIYQIRNRQIITFPNIKYNSIYIY